MDIKKNNNKYRHITLQVVLIINKCTNKICSIKGKNYFNYKLSRIFH